MVEPPTPPFVFVVCAPLDELHRAMPTWLLTAPVATRRRIWNAFTRHFFDGWTRDPRSPEQQQSVESEDDVARELLAFPHAVLGDQVSWPIEAGKPMLLLVEALTDIGFSSTDLDEELLLDLVFPERLMSPSGAVRLAELPVAVEEALRAAEAAPLAKRWLALMAANEAGGPSEDRVEAVLGDLIGLAKALSREAGQRLFLANAMAEYRP